MRNRRGPPWLLAAVAIAWAATGGSGAAADAFDHDWCGHDAGEFTLLTDAPRAEAEAMVRVLQTFRPVAEGYLPGKPNAEDPPLTVMVFRGVRDFRRAIGTGAMVGYMQPSLTENLMVVGPDPHADEPHEALLHEYVHYLLRTRAGMNIPNWYDEGLAGMLGSARFEAGRVVIGELPQRTLRRTIRESNLSLADVLAAEDVWDWRPERIRGFYDFSRLLVHRLLLGQEAGRPDWRPGLADYLAGRAPSLSRALDISPGAMERRLLSYLERRRTTVEHPAAAPVTALPDYRCLPEPDKVMRLSLAIMQLNPQDAVGRLRDLIDRQPLNGQAWIALSLAEEASGHRDAALLAARRAQALLPEDGGAAVRLAGALAMGCILEVSRECRARWQEAVPLLRASLRRDPVQHEAIFTLGLAYLYSGRAGDAVNYLRIAHRRQPWAPPVNFYLGESYRLIGDSRAEGHLQRARRWSPNELWRRLAEAGLERLAAVDDRSAPPPPG